ncbi:MAG: PTS system mannose/fructose/sorbose family transporter subunit IID [Anaerolineaceae bacterium]
MSENRLSKKDLNKAYWNWRFYTGAAYNFARMAGMGFYMMMVPIIHKLYPKSEDQVRELERHGMFYNTEPHLGSIIHGLVCAMEEERANGEAVEPDDIIAIKNSLMGPFAGLGDTVVQAIIIPILLSIGISMALSGNVIGPIFYVVSIVAILYIMSHSLFMRGYKLGKDAVAKMLSDGTLKEVMDAAIVVGAMAMGALTASFVNVRTPIEITLKKATDSAEAITLNLQTGFFDMLFKGLLPLLLVGVLFWLLKEKKIHQTALLVGLIVVTFALGALGIIG